MPTLFEKIAAREIPADIIYEDDLCLCFHDINPQAPIHLLIVPKKPIVRIAEAKPEDKETLGHLLLTAQLVAKQEGFEQNGFRSLYFATSASILCLSAASTSPITRF